MANVRICIKEIEITVTKDYIYTLLLFIKIFKLLNIILIRNVMKQGKNLKIVIKILTVLNNILKEVESRSVG